MGVGLSPTGPAFNRTYIASPLFLRTLCPVHTIQLGPIWYISIQEKMLIHTIKNQIDLNLEHGKISVCSITVATWFVF